MSLTGWIKHNAGPMIVGAVFVILGAVLFGVKVIVDQGAQIKRLATQADARDRETRENNAKAATARTVQLAQLQTTVDGMATVVASLQMQTGLINDCVGLGSPESACAKASAKRFRSLVGSIVDALRSEFGILKGELRITIVQEPGKPPVVTVGGQAPGKTPTVDRTLPPGSVQQDCLVRLNHLTDIADGVLCTTP